MSLISIKEKVGYALGDGAANIAWRGVMTFLMIFYTDVFGLAPAVVGTLIFVARLSDGVSDVFMGVVGDATKSKYGKFRPWVLWTAIPLGVILSMLFTVPNFGEVGNIVYAYATYILFTLIYTANNIPYGALMAVMTGDDKERTSIGSYRMVGAFAGGMIVQGALLFLVGYFGNIDPSVQVTRLDKDKYEVVISAPKDVQSVNVETKNKIATFQFADDTNDTKDRRKSFEVKANKEYAFIVEGEEGLNKDKFRIIDQKQGYSYSMYIMSFFLAVFMLITFASTKERVLPPKQQKTNLKKDLLDLVQNKPWLILVIVGLIFNVYNGIKQGVVLYYFVHFVNDELLAASYMIGLMLISILGAMITSPLGKRLGKRKLFIYALIFSGLVNALLIFCNHDNTIAIFSIGIISELGAAVLPTLFFAMLGDAADYSEFKNGRRATGLIYSAGSFATKFGGGIAALIISFVLTMYSYNGQDPATIKLAIPGIQMLMSWIPGFVAILGSVFLFAYPLNQNRMDEITIELNNRREKA